MANAIPQNICCPLCLPEENPVLAMLGQQELFCNKGHKLQRDNPGLHPGKKLTNGLPQTKPTAPPAGSVEIKAAVPKEVKEKLEARFGQQTEATVAGVLRSIADADTFIVSSDDCARMETVIGTKPRSGSEVVGRLIAMQQELVELKERQQKSDPAPAPSASNGSIVLDLGVDLMLQIEDKAKGVCMTPNALLEQVVAMANTNDWF